MIGRVLVTFAVSVLAWAGAECLTGPVEVLLKAENIARMETRVIGDANQLQATEVKVTTFKDGMVASEEWYRLNNPSDRTTWTYQYQGGRLEKMTGRVEGAVPSLNVLAAATERTFRYNAQGQQVGDITSTVRLGVRLPVSETTCTHSPDGRRVTETIRTLSAAAIHPALLTEYTLDGQGRVVTVTLKDDLGGKMTETNRLVYVYQPQGGYVRMETETNPFSGEVERKGSLTVDRLGRPVRLEVAAGPQASGKQARMVTYSYRFDRVGNWVERVATVTTTDASGKAVRRTGEIVRRSITYMK